MSRTAWQRSSPTAYWSQGDTAPAIAEQLLDGTGTAVNLVGAAVRFQGIFADAASSAQSIDAAATITSAATGMVSYTPLAADTDTIGDLMVQWKVTFGSGAIERFPNSGYQKVQIVKKVA